MKPMVICHMMSSIDGRQHPSRYTSSLDGERRDWTAVYEQVHDDLAGDAWMVGRVTMAEMSKAAPHPPEEYAPVERPIHIASVAESYAVAIDRSGQLHFDGDAVGGDHLVLLMGRDVSDRHLAELAADGISYIVAEDEEMDLGAMLETLSEHFGIKRLLLEGGGTVNGSMFAAGLVDELSVLIAPALDGGSNAQGIVTRGVDGLKGHVEVSLRNVQTLDHGVVHLLYQVQPANDQ